MVSVTDFDKIFYRTLSNLVVHSRIQL